MKHKHRMNWNSFSILPTFGICTVCVFTSVPTPGANIAIYNDAAYTADGEGAWADGVTAIKNMVATLGHTYSEIDYTVLNDPNQNLSSQYDVLVFPGGWAHQYNLWISSLGKQRIRDFINNGGGYFGICAGAFFAADTTVWDNVAYDDYYLGSFFNWITWQWEPFYAYNLDLFSGTATGPISEIGDLSTRTMTTFNFDNANDVLDSYKTVPYTEDILYYGGPYFTVSGGWWGDTAILATYASSTEAAGKAAIIAFEYGSGRVVLSAPHPEIEEDSDRDGVTLPEEGMLNDKGSDWDMVSHILTWLTSSAASCPSLYYWDGEDYKKRSSIFPGATLREQQYLDYIPLTQDLLVEKGGRYQLQIREDDQERSRIDYAGLYIVDHDPSLDIFDYLSIRNTDSEEMDPIARTMYNEYVALPDLALEAKVNRVLPLLVQHSARDNTPQEHARARFELSRPDGQYVETNTGDTITLTFPYRPLPDDTLKRDIIFVGEGYYIPNDDATLDGMDGIKW